MPHDEVVRKVAVWSQGFLLLIARTSVLFEIDESVDPRVRGTVMLPLTDEQALTCYRAGLDFAGDAVDHIRRVAQRLEGA